MLLDFIRGWAFDPKKECFVPHEHAVQHIHSPPRSNPLLYLAFSHFFCSLVLFTPWHLSMSQFPPTSRTCNPYVYPTPSLSSARCPAGLMHGEVMHCGMYPPPTPLPPCSGVTSHSASSSFADMGMRLQGVMGKGHWEIEAHWWHPFLLSSGVKSVVQLHRRPLEWMHTEKTEGVNRKKTRRRNFETIQRSVNLKLLVKLL